MDSHSRKLKSHIDDNGWIRREMINFEDSNIMIIPLNWEHKLTVIFNEYRGALAGKGGKWTEKNLDKYLKSPADYAPGKLKN